MSTRDITLRWDDPNLIEKGYKVYRSKTPMDINNMPVPIATLEPNTTEYIDVGQTIGETNYYRVSAWIDGGELFTEEQTVLVETVIDYIVGFGDRIIKYRNDKAIKESVGYAGNNVYKNNNRVVVEQRFKSKVTLLDDNLNLLWEREEGRWIYGLSVSDNYIIYRYTNDAYDAVFKLTCLDYQNNRVWTRTIGQKDYSLPVDNYVYVSGAMNYVTKLDISNGNTIYTTDDIQERFAVVTSVDVTTGDVYVLGGMDNPKMKKISSDDGSIIYEIPNYSFSRKGQSATNGDLIYLDDGVLYRVNKTNGDKVWEYNTALSIRSFSIVYEESMVVCGAVDSNGNNIIIYIKEFDGVESKQFTIYSTESLRSVCSVGKSELELYMSLK